MRIGRNEPCPCGSGKKYKKCCLNKAQPVSGSSRLKNVKQISNVSNVASAITSPAASAKGKVKETKVSKGAAAITKPRAEKKLSGLKKTPANKPAVAKTKKALKKEG